MDPLDVSHISLGIEQYRPLKPYLGQHDSQTINQQKLYHWTIQCDKNFKHLLLIMQQILKEGDVVWKCTKKRIKQLQSNMKEKQWSQIYVGQAAIKILHERFSFISDFFDEHTLREVTISDEGKSEQIVVFNFGKTKKDRSCPIANRVHNKSSTFYMYVKGKLQHRCHASGCKSKWITIWRDNDEIIDDNSSDDEDILTDVDLTNWYLQWSDDILTDFNLINWFLQWSDDNITCSIHHKEEQKTYCNNLKLAQSKLIHRQSILSKFISDCKKEIKLNQKRIGHLTFMLDPNDCWPDQYWVACFENNKIIYELMDN